MKDAGTMPEVREELVRAVRNGRMRAVRNVVSKFDDKVVVGRTAVMGVETVQEGAQHTSLW